MPLTVEDRLEILELAARYNQALDLRAAEAWAACFTEDGVLERVPDLKLVGRDQLLQYVTGPRRPATPSRHWTNNLVIEGDDDEATLTAYVATITADGSGTWNTHGRYEDRLRRIDGRWRFAHRALTNEARRSA